MKQQNKSYGKILALAAVIVVILVGGIAAGRLLSGRGSGTSVPKAGEAAQTDIAPIETIQGETASSEGVSVYPSAPSGQYETLTFTTAYASSTLEPESSEYHYEPFRAIDGDLITSWQEGAPGDGTGEKLTLSFEKPEPVKYLCLYVGNWRDSERFYNNNRPATMTIEIGDGEYEVSFKDEMSRWYVVFDEPVETKMITFRADTVYNGATSSDLCISEVFAYGGGA